MKKQPLTVMRNGKKNQSKVHPKIKVRLFDYKALKEGTPQHKMAVIFTGGIADCHKFCDNKGLLFHRDESLFGGYYFEEGSGTCYLLDL